jgi:murein tripeptide amidase MpaA
MTPPDPLSTLAERSGFRQTGRIEEVERLARLYAETWPEAVRSLEYGRSAEGRPLRALAVSRAGDLTPEGLRARGIPLLLIQGGIHPGESDGKDAGFMALRALLQEQPSTSVLRDVALLFVPAFNTDGHERVGRWNRPNQAGPEETGWRTTAHNLNLNRDYMKADAPEMRAMLRLVGDWDPLVCADLHVTDGADFEPDVSIQVEPIHQGDPALRASGRLLRDRLIERLAAKGSLPLLFYPDLVRTDDPASGFQLTVYSPRFSTGYFPARNRFSVLVETHSWKEYARRVRVTRETILGLVDLLARHGRDWLREARRADEEGCRAPGREFELDYASAWREPTAGAAPESAGGDVEWLDFRGYAYTREPSELSGAPRTVYDPKTPRIWRVPFRKNTTASLVARAPRRGYVIPAAYAAEVGEKLALHGLATEPFEGGDLELEVFRATRADFAPRPFEGRMRVALEGEWRREPRRVPAKSLLAPVAQPRARLLLGLLEPRAPDSLASWGCFNACFEQKEHVEPYVAELLARRMLEADPGLADEFRRALAADPGFAGSPAARLDFFLRRHPSWDERFNLYPIFRL